MQSSKRSDQVSYCTSKMDFIFISMIDYGLLKHT
jgi:hypothetical protein